MAVCRAALGDAGRSTAGLPLSLFLIGLAGSVVHCVGMCGPFVLGQVVAGAGAARTRYGEWQRLADATLLPYHLGRATTYTALGAIAGATTALFAASPSFAWLTAALLALAAALLIVQSLGLAALPGVPWTIALSRFARPLTEARGLPARYALGVVLGFLPCGLLYGAIAAAAGTGSAAEGAVAMAAFALGTVPALVAVGWGGLMLRRRLGSIARWVATPLLLANAGLLLALASQRL
ncbi:MAG: sulfite exporter TauE/SafE family protein [Enhydrobacter sp.]|nr:MAG: sulfite exporter TauE/SafE family protein [Enhydrobacter sp.]